MKATGIVRRIDDLGRVVIPKEIRRTMRIREGDPLEIYTDNDGEVIFKKYSPIGELGNYAVSAADVLNKNSGKGVIICDRDHCVAASGIPKKEVLERRISSDIEDIMESRKPFCADGDYPIALEGTNYKVSVAVPIIAAGDISGIVILVEENGKNPTESEEKLSLATAGFLAKQMEEY